MNNFIIKNASGRNALILFGLVIIINVLLALSMGSNPDLKPLDLQLHYDADKAYDLIGAYSEAERKTYMLIEMTLDVVYPLIYATLFAFLLFLLHGKLSFAKLPYLITVLDLLENMGIVILLLNYPTRLDTFAQITGILTSLKWLVFAVVLVLFLWGLGKKFLTKKQQPSSTLSSSYKSAQ